MRLETAIAAWFNVPQRYRAEYLRTMRDHLYSIDMIDRMSGNNVKVEYAAHRAVYDLLKSLPRPPKP